MPRKINRIQTFVNQEVIDFFKTEAGKTGIPYQILINSYLLDCVRENRHLDMKWS